MGIKVKDLCKSYHDNYVLKDFNMDMEDGETLCIMGGSGMGKTTLFRILMGLESSDSGKIEGTENLEISAVFQENRLLEELSAIGNLKAVSRGKFQIDRAIRELARVLPKECLTQPVSELSGGMKRRVAMIRAMWIPSHLIILDEPFTGLDMETKEEVINYLMEKKQKRMLIFSTHQIEDCEKLNGKLVVLSIP